ncbi:hypothetical protein BDZ97DRAFT_272582 [Flammula alnicola]|nr:hypothetical protein BDZ97DRAFT_272582 [Flammula alnicola]
MTLEDVCNTLIQQNMIFIREATPPPVRPSPGQTIKFPKGRKNGVARKQLQRMQAQDKDLDGNKGPFVVPKHYEIHFDRQKVEAYLRNWESKGYLRLRPEKLQWTPYLVTRTTQEAAVSHDLPAMDNVPEEKSGTGSFINGRSAEPVTPGPTNGMVVDSPMGADADAEKDELPMLVDTPVSEARTTRSSARSPAKEKEQPRPLKTPRTLRTSRAVSPPSTPEPPPPPPQPRSLRTRSSRVNIPAVSVPVGDPPNSVRPSRKGDNRRSSRKMEVAEDDEALAAKLAMEEQMQGRQLRSGRGEARSENKRPASAMAVTPKTPTTRKRRRIDSSPEVEDSPSPEAPEPAETQPVNGQNGSAESPMAVDSVSPKVNGKQNDYLEQHPLETQTPETLDITTPVDDMHPTSAMEEVKEVMAKEETDVKSEDRGTPLTSLKSRQSLPSDDTVFLTDTLHASVINAAPNKFGDYHGVVHAESDLRSTLGPAEVDLDDCHDEDAEGEYEEDAEGEPDSEYC